MRARRGRRTRVRETGSRHPVATSGPIVVDASVAFLWFANEPDRSGAARLLETESVLMAPDLMAVEVANAWWKKLRRHQMEMADIEQAVTNLLALGIDWTPSGQLLHPAAVLGLGDGGAHCGMICDASLPTYSLTHWARDRSRGEKLPLEWLVKKQTKDTAELYGMTDRGTLEVGQRADLNVIDHEALTLRSPRLLEIEREM